MVKYCLEYWSLQCIFIVFIIYNGVYYGNYGWDKMYLLLFFDVEVWGLFDWWYIINLLVIVIKCVWWVIMVLFFYLEELWEDFNGMEALLQYECYKCLGIINGIDIQVWLLKEDFFLFYNWIGSFVDFKQFNKVVLGLCFCIDLKLLLVIFIGWLVGEKGVDLLFDFIDWVLQLGMQVVFVVLGIGQYWIYDVFWYLVNCYFGCFDVVLEYNEGLVYQLYVGFDFLMMFFCVEFCGLN